MASAHNHSLSTLPITKSQRQYQDMKLQYVNLQGQEIITVIPSPELVEAVTPKPDKLWDWAIIDFITPDYDDLQGRLRVYAKSLGREVDSEEILKPFDDAHLAFPDQGTPDIDTYTSDDGNGITCLRVDLRGFGETIGAQIFAHYEYKGEVVVVDTTDPYNTFPYGSGHTTLRIDSDFRANVRVSTFDNGGVEYSGTWFNPDVNTIDPELTYVPIGNPTNSFDDNFTYNAFGKVVTLDHHSLEGTLTSGSPGDQYYDFYHVVDLWTYTPLDIFGFDYVTQQRSVDMRVRFFYDGPIWIPTKDLADGDFSYRWDQEGLFPERPLGAHVAFLGVTSYHAYEPRETVDDPIIINPIEPTEIGTLVLNRRWAAAAWKAADGGAITP